jgi:DNA-binding NarL/FixJ family response regulator
MKDTKIYIAIVDDNGVNRKTLSTMLPYSGEVEVVFVASNGQDFLDKMKNSMHASKVQLVLMDIEMPVLDGIETVKIAAEEFPNVAFVMLTVLDDDDKIFEAVKAGAVGYLLKEEGIDNIVASIIETVHLGGSPMSPSIARRALQLLAAPSKPTKAEPQHDLSVREVEILQLLTEGHDYKSIADKLFLSSHTVRTHIYNIYKKLHVSSKSQAVSLALKKNWF